MTREQLIRLIHVAKRSLQLDDDTYRQLLINHTSLDSTRDMKTRQLEIVLQAMKDVGFKPRTEKTREKITATDDQSRKIRALWLEMADAGFIRDRSERAINAFVYRCTGVGRLDWLSSAKASQVIEKLKQWQKRELALIAPSS